MRRAAWMLIFLAGCGRQGGDEETADARPGPDGFVFTDARIITDASRDAASDCAWSFAPTNFDPCALPPSNGDQTVTIETSFNTDSGEATTANGTSTLQSGIVTQVGGPEVRVLVYRNLTLQAPFRVTGSRPLLIVALDTLEVTGDAGEIDVSAPPESSGPGGGDATACATGAGGLGHGPQSDTTGASGGGGGGFGAGGGKGGQGEGVSGGTEGATSGTTTLSPLRGGCAGGTGGIARGIAGGGGGGGGGALQIAAKRHIKLSGRARIRAAGGGGAVAAGSAGGGGGGSGGAIFLEAPRITFEPVEVNSVRLCANGGSGGEGGGFGQGASGAGGSCTDIGGATTPDNSGGGDGGGGGYRFAPTGGPGSGGGSPGGGGGGGGVGRIRIRAIEESPIFTGSMISPAAVTN